MSLIDTLYNWIDFLKSIWDFINKIFVTVLNFVQNILNFFKNPSRLKKLKQDSNKLAIAIKENLDNGEYRVVNCLFDKEEQTIVDMNDEAQGIEAKDMDYQTERTFGNRDMIILK